MPRATRNSIKSVHIESIQSRTNTPIPASTVITTVSAASSPLTPIPSPLPHQAIRLIASPAPRSYSTGSTSSLSSAPSSGPPTPSASTPLIQSPVPEPSRGILHRGPINQDIGQENSDRTTQLVYGSRKAVSTGLTQFPSESSDDPLLFTAEGSSRSVTVDPVDDTLLEPLVRFVPPRPAGNLRRSSRIDSDQIAVPPDSIPNSLDESDRAATNGGLSPEEITPQHHTNPSLSTPCLSPVLHITPQTTPKPEPRERPPPKPDIIQRLFADSAQQSPVPNPNHPSPSPPLTHLPVADPSNPIRDIGLRRLILRLTVPSNTSAMSSPASGESSSAAHKRQAPDSSEESELSDAPPSSPEKRSTAYPKAKEPKIPRSRSTRDGDEGGKRSSEASGSNTPVDPPRRSRRSVASRTGTPISEAGPQTAPTPPNNPPTPPPRPPSPPIHVTPVSGPSITSTRSENSSKKVKNLAKSGSERDTPGSKGTKRKQEPRDDDIPAAPSIKKIKLNIGQTKSPATPTTQSDHVTEDNPKDASVRGKKGKRKSIDLDSDATIPAKQSGEKQKDTGGNEETLERKPLKKPTGKTRRNVLRSESPEAMASPAVEPTLDKTQKTEATVSEANDVQEPVKKKSKGNKADGEKKKANETEKTVGEATEGEKIPKIKVITKDKQVKDKDGNDKVKEKSQSSSKETPKPAGKKEKVERETKEVSKPKEEDTVAKKQKDLKQKKAKAQTSTPEAAPTPKTTTGSPAATAEAPTPEATTAEDGKPHLTKTKASNGKPETPVNKRPIHPSGPSGSAIKGTPDPTSSLHKKKKPPPPRPVPDGPSLLQSTLAALHSKATQNKDDKEKEKKKTVKKGQWADSWVMTPDQQKEFDESASQREAERKARAAYSANAVNLQEAKDAYRKDSLNPRILPPIGIRLTEDTRPSILIARMRAHIAALSTAESTREVEPAEGAQSILSQ